MLTARAADRTVTFRNLGWSGDTPTGTSRTGLSLLQAGREPADEGWTQLQQQITDAKPTVIFVGYGMANSFDGPTGEQKFAADYTRLLDTLAKLAPTARLVLLSPARHETLGAAQADRRRAQRRPRAPLRHSRAISPPRAVCRSSRSSTRSPRPWPPPPAAKLTDNGIHLNAAGYRAAAFALEDFLFGAERAAGPAGAWRTSPAAEPLRQAILRKNEWFFHRSRPANMAYIFGFRKKEQGQNAVEVLKFESFIAAEEARIARLRSLDPAAVAATPEIPARVGNLVAKFIPQPTPKFTVDEALEVTLWAENPCSTNRST
jgi:lysophospholipase L1-like esterase